MNQSRNDEVRRIRSDYRVQIMWWVARTVFGVFMVALGSLAVGKLNEVSNAVDTWRTDHVLLDGVKATQDQVVQTLKQLTRTSQVQTDSLKELTNRVTRDETDGRNP